MYFKFDVIVSGRPRCANPFRAQGAKAKKLEELVAEDLGSGALQEGLSAWGSTGFVANFGSTKHQVRLVWD